jgi:hypothetical protein
MLSFFLSFFFKYLSFYGLMDDNKFCYFQLAVYMSLILLYISINFKYSNAILNLDEIVAG